MKKILLILLTTLCSITVMGQAVQIFHDGETEPKVFANGAIQKISFHPKFLGSTEYQQVYETLDGEFRFDKVDSVKFNLPHLVSYKNEYVLPRDADRFHPRYSSSYSSVTIPGMNPLWGVNWSGWYYVDYDRDAEFPQTSEYGLCAGDVRVPFKVTLSDKYALPYFFVKFRNKDAVTNDSLRFLTNAGDVRILSPEVESLIFPGVAKNLSFTSSNYMTISNPEFMYRYLWRIVGDYDWKNTSISSMLKTRYDEEGNFIIDMPEYDEICRRFNFSVGNEYFNTWQNYYIDQAPKTLHTEEEHMQALRDLYDSTDGPNWVYQDLWWSDKPIYRWDHLCYHWGEGEPIVSNTVYCMSFQFRETGIHGTIPESFATFLDDCVEINFEGCRLYGVIPYNVRHNKNWQKWGWNIIPQNVWNNPGFDFADINLHIDNVEVEDFVNETTTTTYNVLKKNKLTWVFNAGMVDMIDGISDQRVNLYLDYCNKGFGIVAQVERFWDTPYTNYKKWVIGQQQYNNLPKEILWVKTFDKAISNNLGSMSVLDSEGNLVWFSNMDGAIPESIWIQKVDSICRQYLGEPEAHDPYVSRHYESSDYSMDGDVVTLQKATVGKGIDLVFMGDQYVDTMMVAGGMYEQDMTASMEYFFDIEPYKSLRDRFNVYYVKVVSKNGYDGPDCHRLGYDHDLVFDYARKIPDVDMDNVTISVIWGNPNFSFFISGETAMFDSGASIAYIGQGGPSSVICHEAGGHGFAKLIDEYIYAGMEDNHTQPGAEESFKNWIKTAYHDRGWGMNVAATDDPELVPWAHFLKDERYKDEVGVYQGAWNWPEDLWRSTDNSVMKDGNYLWFNAPSREAIYKRVMQLSEGDSWTYDYETFVAFDQEVIAKARAAAKAKTATPKVNKIFIERAPQIVNDKFMSVPQSKRKAPAAKQSPRLNIPKDKTLMPVDQYKGDISKARTIYVEGVKYVIE